jgi:purine-binding chemotaxis protein CheW
MTRLRRPSSRPPTSPKAEWTALCERLARAQLAVAATLDLPPDRIRCLLDTRARALARPVAADERTDHVKVLTFGLGGERYAIGIGYVREVARLDVFTPVPGAPDFVYGVTSLRGQLLPIFDLGALCHLPAAARQIPARYLVVLGTNAREFALTTDEVYEVAALRPAELLPLPTSMVPVPRKYVLGLTQEALVVLDGAALLDDPRLYLHEGQTTAG